LPPWRKRQHDRMMIRVRDLRAKGKLFTKD
jgi:hypothetical protein